MTLQPLLVYERVSDARVERVIADGYYRTFNLSKRFTPIVDMIDLHASGNRHLGGALGCRGQSHHQELFVVGDHPMRSGASRGQTVLISFTRTQSQGRVRDRVVN